MPAGKGSFNGLLYVGTKKGVVVVLVKNEFSMCMIRILFDKIEHAQVD